MEKCILIYEDDMDILFFCKQFLSQNQYRVETLSRCENVISDIESIKPDLILMDLWIPVIGGEKAIFLIKQNPSTQHIPVLLFSANAEIKEICKKINADGYIEKPFDIQTLKETIAQNILRYDTSQNATTSSVHDKGQEVTKGLP
ncbi:MAG: response regulator receiver protein [Ferruginibacter sp.]|uniref:response regulator n=1 Tax=Ferruginibacter sp. TaxID=1940288 RepID=UPI00265A23BE|nr:response regulator [Ferruginibacter sp.]MDB5279254.1 response regulator receiver protein [Ferruginibacter sp.]